MGYSFYEVYITSQRAFRAMGFPFGADEDAGFIIAWLELNNFKGATILHKLIKDLDQQYDGTIKIENLNEKINFKNKSILMKGPGLIDYMQSKINDEEKISFEITNCFDGILFLPLLYKISKKINFSQLFFSNSKNEINVYQVINNKIIFACEKNVNSIPLGQIKITMDNNKKYKKKLNKNIISEKIIQKNLSTSLTPKNNIWEKISKIANRTFVPETDESRNKGAGGGDAND